MSIHDILIPVKEQQGVWLLTANFNGGSSDDDFQPYLIYLTRTIMIDSNPTITWNLIDTDACRGSDNQGFHYYATPWPVHGSER